MRLQTLMNSIYVPLKTGGAFKGVVTNFALERLDTAVHSVCVDVKLVLPSGGEGAVGTLVRLDTLR